MVAARDADFTGEGTVGLGTAPGALTLEEQARLEEDKRARKAEEDKLRRLGRLGPQELGTGNTQRGRGFDPSTGRYRTAEDLKKRPDTGSFVDTIGPTLKAISRDPVTAGILLAPYGVAGAGAAFGGFATGGAGTIAGGALPSAAPAMTAPFGMASPFAAPTAAGVPAMGTPAMMASPFAAGGGTGTAAGGAGAASAAKDAWTWKDSVKTAAPLAGWAAQTIGEQLIRGGGKDEERKLREKQEQIARETEQRRAQMQQARMDSLGARMVAFDPHNQMLARMFGPDAAFKPEQLAGMVENPMKPQLPPELQNYQGTDDKKERQINDFMAAEAKYKAAEEARRNRVMGGVQQPGPGPAPFAMPAPQAARRY